MKRAKAPDQFKKKVGKNIAAAVLPRQVVNEVLRFQPSRETWLGELIAKSSGYISDDARRSLLRMLGIASKNHEALLPLMTGRVVRWLWQEYQKVKLTLNDGKSRMVVSGFGAPMPRTTIRHPVSWDAPRSMAYPSLCGVTP